MSRLLSIPVLSLLVACPSVIDDRGDRTSPVGRDHNRAGTLSLDETEISARMQAGDVQVAFPLVNSGASSRKTTIQIRLLDLAPLEVTSSEIVQINRLLRPGKNQIVVPIPGALEGGGGRYVVAITVRSDDHEDISVRRSLFVSVERLQLQMVAAPVLPAEGSSSLRAFVQSTRESVGLAGAQVKVFGSVDDGEESEWAVGSTDADGSVTLQINTSEPLGQRASLRLVAEHELGTAALQHQVSLQRSLRLLLTTDKPRYQPGQVIHLRALALRLADRHPIAEEDLVFEVYDGKDNRVHRSNFETDEFGAASLAFQLADRVNEGSYRLVAKIGDTETERFVPVERYRLPVFAVTTEAESNWFKPGDVLSGTLSARYHFGEPVAGAQVQIQAETKQGEGFQVFQVHNGSTDANGNTPFEFEVPANFSAQALTGGDAAVRLTTTVVDGAGQREIVQRAWRVAAGSALVNLVPENGALVPGASNRVIILARDPGGAALALPMTVSAPGVGARRLNTDAQGLAHLDLPPEAVGESIHLTIEPPGQPAFEQSVNLPVSSGQQFLLRPERRVLAAPGTLRVTAIVPGGQGPVFLDVTKAGTTLGTAQGNLEAGEANLEIQLDQRFHGGLALSALARQADGSLVTGRAMVYVEALPDLNVELSFGQEQYRPGETAELTVQVRDGDGEGRRAGLGITAVDEAVFALGDAAPGRLKTHFDLSDEAGEVAGPVSPRRVLAESDSERREALAQFAFPAAVGQISLVQLDSEIAASTEVRHVLRHRMRLEGQRIGEMIQETLNQGQVDWELLEARVQSLIANLSDPFGQPYRSTGSMWNMRLSSAGPDEVFDTDDDVTTRISPLGALRNGEVDMAEGAPAAGGGGGGNEPDEEGVVQDEANASGSGGVKVRSWFPETLFVQPNVIVDANGQAQVQIPLADSITTWRVGAQANSQSGELGSGSAGLEVFQPFFVDIDLPSRLSVGDQIDLPVVVYNYLETAQEVDLELAVEGPLDLVSNASQSLRLGAGEVRGLRYTIRARSVGTASLTITGRAGEEADAVHRTLRIRPDGDPVEQTEGGRAEGSRNQVDMNFPGAAVPEANELMVKLYPGYATNAVEGMESMLRVPSGCFEQTTSTSWPNILALQYLEHTGEVDPDLRSRAFELLASGYQRILTFESPTGGYNWWGNSDPGNRILTAIALMQFADLRGLIETDSRVADRHRAWLVDQQEEDGSWAGGDALHSGNEALGTSPYRTTAFITWGLAKDGGDLGAARRARDFLVANIDAVSQDLYSLALMTNALIALDPEDSALPGLLTQLAVAVEPAGEGQKKWTFAGASWTGSRGGGKPGEVEMTGLVVHALIKSGQSNELVEEGLAFLAATKDAFGNWYSTQATVNSLRALLTAAMEATRDINAEVVISINDQEVQSYDFRNESFGDVHLTTDLTDHVRSGDNRINVSINGEGSLMYQVVGTHYRRWTDRPSPNPDRSLGLTVEYDRNSLAPGETTRVTATATNRANGTMDQVIVSIGRAPGLDLMPEDLDRLVDEQLISRWEANPRKIVFYLMGLPVRTPRALSFRLRARYPMQANAPSSSIDSYYEPGSGEATGPVALGVSD